MERADNPRPWTISRSEWDGLLARRARWDRICGSRRWRFLIAVTGLGAGAFVGAFFGDRMGGWWWGIAASAYIATMLVVALQGLRRHAELSRALGAAWDDGGCVCPLCRRALPTRTEQGEAPRCPHGLSRDDQPDLVEYWEAQARRDDVTAWRGFAALAARAPKRSFVVRLARFLARNMSTAQDHGRQLGARYLAALQLTGYFSVPMVVVLAFGLADLTPRTVPLLVAYLGVMLLVTGPFAVMGVVMRRRAEARCSACRQLLANPHPARCPECGVDLSSPAAVTTAERRFEFRYAAISILSFALPILGLFGFLTFAVLGGFAYLPNAVLVPLAEGNGLSAMSARDALTGRSLSPRHAVDLAERLIERAEGDLAATREPSRPLGLGHIPAAVAAGTLPPEFLGRALSASVAADAAIEIDADGATVLRFTPRFGSDLFAPWGKAAIVLESVRFDGGDAVGAWAEPRFRDGGTPFVVPVPAGASRADWSLRIAYLPHRAEPTLTFGPNGELAALEGADDEVTLRGSLEFAP